MNRVLLWDALERLRFLEMDSELATALKVSETGRLLEED